MSNDKKASRRKYREIPSVRATAQETTATQNTVKRLLGRLPIDGAQSPGPPPELPTLGTQSTESTQGTQNAPAAPVRDFQKVANSITRVAVPAGVFKGKCKQLYDFMYSKTRGAIVPTRSAQLTRREIMKGSDIGSTKTLFLNLRHLRDAGLITWDERVGPHEGNVYSVHLPEEAAARTVSTQSTLGTLSTESASSPKVDRVLGVESTLSTQCTSQAESKTSGESKTSFKTNTNDDDEAAPRALREAERELTGKESSLEKWSELFELLAAELRIAAARTTVSSVPPFLTEHLRRRLWKKDKKQVEAEEKTEVGVRVDANKCPDCGGSGFYYPQGFDAGVAKCRHEKLMDPS